MLKRIIKLVHRLMIQDYSHTYVDSLPVISSEEYECVVDHPCLLQGREEVSYRSIKLQQRVSKAAPQRLPCRPRTCILGVVSVLEEVGKGLKEEKKTI